MSTAVATELRTLCTAYINHKLKLSACSNYKGNMRFQRSTVRLREFKKWMQNEGKLANETAVLRMAKMYKPDFYNALPHPKNAAYQSSMDTLTEIFE